MEESLCPKCGAYWQCGCDEPTVFNAGDAGPVELRDEWGASIEYIDPNASNAIEFDPPQDYRDFVFHIDDPVRDAAQEQLIREWVARKFPPPA